MKTTTNLAAALATITTAAAAAPPPPADISPQDAGARFTKNCSGCHQPPDLTFATDRAWLAQLRETA